MRESFPAGNEGAVLHGLDGHRMSAWPLTKITGSTPHRACSTAVHSTRHARHPLFEHQAPAGV